MVDPTVDGLLDSVGAGDLDTVVGGAVEGGYFYSDNSSLGLEYMLFSTEAELSEDLTTTILNDPSLAADKTTINNYLSSQGYGNLAAGNMSVKEEYDINQFLATINYNQALTDEFSIIYTIGVGLVHAEQKLGVTVQSEDNDPDQAGDQTGTVNVNSNADDVAIAYKLGLAAGYHFNESLTLSAGFKYLGTADFKFNRANNLGNFKENLTALIYEVGVSYSF